MSWDGEALVRPGSQGTVVRPGSQGALVRQAEPRAFWVSAVSWQQ